MTDPTDQRAAVINGLRALADLYEKVPDLPLKKQYGIGLWVTDDAEADAQLDVIAVQLRDVGCEVTDTTDSEQRRVAVRLGGISLFVYHFLAAHDERLIAQGSYADNIQVDPQGVSA